MIENVYHKLVLFEKHKTGQLMKVVVLKSKSKHCWYYNCIGFIYDAEESETHFLVREYWYDERGILKEDCDVIK